PAQLVLERLETRPRRGTGRGDVVVGGVGVERLDDLEVGLDLRLGAGRTDDDARAVLRDEAQALGRGKAEALLVGAEREVDRLDDGRAEERRRRGAEDTGHGRA